MNIRPPPLRWLLLAILCPAALPVSAAGSYRAVVGLGSDGPHHCGSSVSIEGWDIRIVREQAGRTVITRIDARPQDDRTPLPVLARLDVDRFEPAVLLVPQDGRLTLPGFATDSGRDWITLIRNFMFFGGTLTLGHVDRSTEIRFDGPAPRHITAQYLDCSGNLSGHPKDIF